MALTVEAKTVNKAVEIQRELLNLALEFFERATGKSPEVFADLDSFSEKVRASAKTIAPRGEAAFEWASPGSNASIVNTKLTFGAQLGNKVASRQCWVAVAGSDKHSSPLSEEYSSM
jgi:hypothetical protein